MLHDGTNVTLLEDHRQQYIGLHVYHRIGASRDSISEQGYATVLAEMLNKGTKSRTAKDIAETIDYFGGYLNAASGWDATSVSLSLLRRHFNDGVELMKDILQNADYPEDELTLLKMQRLASIEYSKTDADYLADTLLNAVIFAGHPYSLQSLGTEKTINAVQRTDLLQRHQDLLAAGDRFIIAVGDITEADIHQAFGSYFTEPNDSDSVNNMPNLHDDRFRIVLVKKHSAVQSSIRVGHTGVSRNHPELTDISVMNVILGGYFNSRINANLREKHGFTYGARSYFDARKHAGAFAVSTEVRTDVTRRAVDEIITEMKRLQDEPILDSELQTVKNYLIGSFPLSIETPQQIAGRLANIRLYNFPDDHYDRYLKRVAELSVDDIHTAAKKYLKPDAVTIAISGDTDVLMKQLDTLGGIELYNTDFERIG